MESNLYKPMGRLERMASYVIILLSATLSAVFFCLFNRLHVHGWRNFKRRKNTLLLPNHRTMIDSFLVGLLGCFPEAIWRPDLMPYHTAAAENFFSSWLLAFFARMWRSIPIKPGRKDPTALRITNEIIADGVVMMFPEGTRSRDGTIGEGRLGVGRLILDTKPQTVPVFVAGMDKVLPIGSRIPRIGKRIDVYFGRPVDLSPYLTRNPSRETTQQAVDRVISELRLLEKIHYSGMAISWTHRMRARLMAVWCLAVDLAKVLFSVPRQLARVFCWSKS